MPRKVRLSGPRFDLPPEGQQPLPTGEDIVQQQQGGLLPSLLGLFRTQPPPGTQAPGAEGTPVPPLPGEPPGLTPGPSMEAGAAGLEPSKFRDPSGRWKIPLRDMPSVELELQDFVRQQGGIRLEGETDVPGELRALISRKETGTSGLQNNQTGISLQAMAEKASEYGFTPAADKVELLTALDRSVRQGQAVFSYEAQGTVPLIDDPMTREAYQTLIDLARTLEGKGQAMRRDGRSAAEAHAEAQAMIEAGEWTRQDLREMVPGSPISDTTAAATLHFLKMMGGGLRKSMQRFIDSGARVGSLEERAMLEIAAMYGAIAHSRMGHLAEAERISALLKDPASGLQEHLRRLDSLLTQSPGMSSLTFARRGLAIPDDVALSKTLIKQAQQGSIFDELYYNGMLSGWRTHLANFRDGLQNAAFGVPIHYIAAIYGNLLPGGEVGFREATAKSLALVEGLRDGWTYAHQAFTTNQPQLEVEKRQELGGLAKTPYAPALTAERMGLDPNNWVGKAFDFWATWVGFGTGGRLPSRMLMTADEFSTALVYRMELHALAQRHAGLLPKEERGQFITDFLENPPDEARLLALQSSMAATYNLALQEGTLGTLMQNVQGWQPWGWVPAGRILLPFVRIGVTMTRQAVAHTPLGLASREVLGELQAGGAARDLALARMTFGSLVMAGLAGLVGTVLFGRGPEDKELRAAGHWDEKQYTLRLPGTDHHISYRNWGILGMWLGMMADTVQLIGEAEVEGLGDLLQDVAVGAYYVFSRNLLSSTWMPAMAKFFDAVTFKSGESAESFGKGLTQFMQQVAGQAIPGSWSMAEKATDPVLREMETVLDGMYAKIPGWSKDLPARRNRWGDKRLMGWGFDPEWAPALLNAVSPDQLTTVSLSPLEQVLVDNKISDFGMPSKTLLPDAATSGSPIEAGLDLDPSSARPLTLTKQEYERYVLYRAANLPELRELGLDYDPKILEQIRRGVAAFVGQMPPADIESAKAMLDWVVETPRFQSDYFSGGAEGGKAAVLHAIDDLYAEAGTQQFLIRHEDVYNRYYGAKDLKQIQLAPPHLRPQLKEQMERGLKLQKERLRVGQ